VIPLLSTNRRPILLLGISLVNVVVTRVGGPFGIILSECAPLVLMDLSINVSLLSIHRVLHAIISTRLLLNIRKGMFSHEGPVLYHDTGDNIIKLQLLSPSAART
jgi:hypothetical protein